MCHDQIWLFAMFCQVFMSYLTVRQLYAKRVFDYRKQGVSKRDSSANSANIPENLL